MISSVVWVSSRGESAASTGKPRLRSRWTCGSRRDTRPHSTTVRGGGGESRLGTGRRLGGDRGKVQPDSQPQGQLEGAFAPKIGWQKSRLFRTGLLRNVWAQKLKGRGYKISVAPTLQGRGAKTDKPITRPFTAPAEERLPDIFRRFETLALDGGRRRKRNELISCHLWALFRMFRPLDWHDGCV
ncbi:unnamed protein product [Bursaphelenchus xylophilus]|uniref:(pine wood nematode) hypothetical protein n=1 Tax=Bursaphelenchus xylophilus TaxID=6326 RepID=A0A1I7SQP8_BURXY|nr:unnamed protein product [Bursaphelenchus xylophilus]CAG9110209.1 unnamed protein product [Bursaphelenchus xylophilus]